MRNCAEIEPPKNEAQARPLAQLDTKEEQIQAWRSANEKAKLSERPVTANDVKEAVNEIKETKQPEKKKELEDKKEVVELSKSSQCLCVDIALLRIVLYFSLH